MPQVSAPSPMVRRVVVAAGLASVLGFVLVASPGSASVDHHRHYGWYAGHGERGGHVELQVGPHHVVHFVGGGHDLGPADVERGQFGTCGAHGCYLGYWVDDRTIAGAWTPRHHHHLVEFVVHPVP